MKEEELAFLKAHLVKLPAIALRQLRRDILQERRKREAEVSAKVKGSGDRLTFPTEEAPALLQTTSLAAMGKRKAKELDSSDSGGSLEPATRRPAPGPKPGVGSAPRSPPNWRRKKSTGAQPDTSRRQVSYAEVSKPSGTLKPTSKETGTAAVPAASKDAAPRRRSVGPSGSVPGPLSGKPEGTTFTAAQEEDHALPLGATQQNPDISIESEEHEEVPPVDLREDREQATGPNEGSNPHAGAGDSPRQRLRRSKRS
jgi:hypothetical protein